MARHGRLRAAGRQVGSSSRGARHKGLAEITNLQDTKTAATDAADSHVLTEVLLAPGFLGGVAAALQQWNAETTRRDEATGQSVYDKALREAYVNAAVSAGRLCMWFASANGERQLALARHDDGAIVKALWSIFGDLGACDELWVWPAFALGNMLGRSVATDNTALRISRDVLGGMAVVRRMRLARQGCYGTGAIEVAPRSTILECNLAVAHIWATLAERALLNYLDEPSLAVRLRLAYRQFPPLSESLFF